ncbi:hypothetical protein ACSHXN_19605 [Streptomyces sp. HUAS TT11]|uniref:hypothetical protein n=1 Tax=Streptomyces sp. HUAS TT11 TaxID=3447508 RepID=UPI003F657505
MATLHEREHYREAIMKTLGNAPALGSERGVDQGRLADRHPPEPTRTNALTCTAVE